MTIWSVVFGDLLQKDDFCYHVRMKVEPILYDSYIAVIKNSVGTNMFRSLYARVDGKKEDILRGGDISCAFFVSSVLLIFRLVKEIHVTVAGTERDIKKFGWKKNSEPRPGAIIVWKPKFFKESGETHNHIGFYIGEEKAVSNDHFTGIPVVHDWLFRVNGESGRNATAIYWHEKLDEK